jgi:hypothetical protein
MSLPSRLYPSTIRLVCFLSLGFLLLTAAAWSQCKPPSDPGVVICAPTNKATVVTPVNIDVQATPAQGATITGIIVYDNNVELYSGGPYDGWNYIVANAWDSDGNLYQASTDVYATGLGYAPCPQPATPSVIICSPTAGSIYPTSIYVDAVALGKSNITNLSWYLNGTYVGGIKNTYGAAYNVVLPSQGTNNTVKVVATDASGDTYSASQTFNADYTYGAGYCGYGTCYPGIQITEPTSDAYVGNTFNINAQILYNPNPITTMKAYLDDNVVASSTNATLQAEVSGQPNGTHILTIQGWDDKGIEYRLQENININVNE